MAPLFVQIVATLSARLFTSWREAARIGIAIMLLFTGISHFSTLKHDLAAMIPPPFTGSLSLIYLTGVLEIAGAAGLLTRIFRIAAAWSLAGMMLALFPANVYAAIAGVTPWRTARDVPVDPRSPAGTVVRHVVVGRTARRVYENCRPTRCYAKGVARPARWADVSSQVSPAGESRWKKSLCAFHFALL